MSLDKVDLSRRAYLDELMDGPCSYEEFRACLRSLSLLNRVTGTHRPTSHWLKRFPADQPLHIVDVGCGGGDMLRSLEKTAQRRGQPLRLTGVDLNPYATRAAREATPAGSRIEWITGDAFSTELPAPVDLVISSLFVHHLPDAEIVRFIQWMEATARRGWFVNDLHRTAFPYYVLRVLPTLMRAHRFVRHDAPVSVRRAFRRPDWQGYLAAAGVALDAVTLETFRPARLCVSRIKR